MRPGILDQTADARGHPDHEALVLTACLDEADLYVRIGAEAVGEHAACAASPNDHIVISSSIWHIYSSLGGSFPLW